MVQWEAGSMGDSLLRIAEALEQPRADFKGQGVVATCNVIQVGERLLAGVIVRPAGHRPTRGHFFCHPGDFYQQALHHTISQATLVHTDDPDISIHFTKRDAELNAYLEQLEQDFSEAETCASTSPLPSASSTLPLPSPSSSPLKEPTSASS